MTFLDLTFMSIVASIFCEKKRYFNHSTAKSRRTDKLPTLLKSLQPVLTILVILGIIYFLTKFFIFLKGLHHVFLRKMAKIKSFQVLMPISWKLSGELNEVWHSSIWRLWTLWHPKQWLSSAKKKDSDFSQNHTFFQRFFNHSKAKSRRTAKRPTFLSSLQPMLTILVILGKIYFLTKFFIFYKGWHHVCLQKMSKVKSYQILMPINWKLSDELNEVWHSSIWRLWALWFQKLCFSSAIKTDSDFSQNYNFFNGFQS